MRNQQRLTTASDPLNQAARGATLGISRFLGPGQVADVIDALAIVADQTKLIDLGNKPLLPPPPTSALAKSMQILDPGGWPPGTT